MKKVMVLLAALMLVVGTTAAWAVPTVNFLEDPVIEGKVTTTTSGFTSPIPVFGINPKVDSDDPEMASVTSILTSNFVSAGVLGTLYGSAMLEPAFEPVGSGYRGVSDVAFLFVTPALLGKQSANLLFMSDGAGSFSIAGHDFSGFDAAVDFFLDSSLVTHVKSFTETGGLDNLFNFTGLVVNAQSDVVPVPGSVVLFGTGLLGLVPVWRLRRKA